MARVHQLRNPPQTRRTALSIQCALCALCRQLLAVDSFHARVWLPDSALSSGLSLSADLVTVVSNRVKIVRMIRNLRHSLRALVGAPHAKFREQIGSVRAHSQSHLHLLIYILQFSLGTRLGCTGFAFACVYLCHLVVAICFVSDLLTAPEYVAACLEPPFDHSVCGPQALVHLDMMGKRLIGDGKLTQADYDSMRCDVIVQVRRPSVHFWFTHRFIFHANNRDCHTHHSLAYSLSLTRAPSNLTYRRHRC